MARPADPGEPPAVRAIVLAAGAARRFGSDKLLAALDGRPLLEHVRAARAAGGLDHPVVVVRPGATALADLATALGAEVAVNPTPDAGLASSLRVGWAAAMSGVPPPDAALVALADQPRLVAAVVRELAEQPLDPARPVVAPRYAGGGGRNPVRLERSAEGLILAAAGDRGLGPVIAAMPGLVRSIAVAGVNSDVDTPTDLLELDARGASGRP